MQGLPVVLSSIETLFDGEPAWERRSETLDPNTNTVNLWIDEEAQSNNPQHLPEDLSVLTLTCAFNDMQERVPVVFTNRAWVDVCEWVYFRLVPPAVGRVGVLYVVCG